MNASAHRAAGGRAALGARFVAASIAAAAWIAILDGIARAATGGSSAPTPAGVGVTLGAALLLGAAGGAILWALAALARVDGPARAHSSIAGLAGSPLRIAVLGAGAFAIPAALAIPARAALLVRHPGLAAVVDLAAVAAGWTLAAACWRLAGRGRTGSPRALGGVLCALAAIGAAAFLPHRPALASADVWDLVLLGDGALAGAGAALLLPAPRRPRAVVAIAVLAAALGGAGAVAALDASAGLRDEVAGEARPGGWLVGLLASAADLDGDGFSPFLGGGDCDDRRADVNPAAIEIPGNGMDENCRGGDRLPELPWARRPSFVPVPAGAAPRSILLVVVDSLRPDRLGAYGYRRPTSPRLDALAASGALFTRAYSSAPTTRLAVPLLHTGRYVGRIPWDRRTAPYALRDGVATVAEILKRERGFSTRAFVTHRYLGAAWGWSRGFDVVDDEFALPDEELAATATGLPLAAKVAAWIRDHRDERFFAWVHLMDPHKKYLYHRADGAPDFGGEEADRYDGEVWYTDRAIGVLLDALEAAGLAGSTLVVVTADHGEALGEHGRSAHGGSLYEEVARIPLVLRGPGVARGRHACATGLVDLAPTLLNLVGVDGAARGMSGATLVPELAGAPCPGDREIVLELRHGRLGAPNLRALVGARWKLIADVSRGTYRLYDLAADPGERTNLAGERPQIAAAMRARLAAWSEVYADGELADIAAEFASDAPPDAAARIDAAFENGVALEAVELGGAVAGKGHAPELAVYFRVAAPLRGTCAVVFSLVDAAGARRFADAHDPVNGSFPLARWPVGRVVEDRFPLDLARSPLKIPDGAYGARIGLECDGRRVRAEGRDVDAEGRAMIGTIAVDAARGRAP